MIAKRLSLDKDPRHLGKLGLQPNFELRDRRLDPTHRYGVVEIKTECDEQITRTEMHRQDFVDADDARCLRSDPRMADRVSGWAASPVSRLWLS